MPESLDLLLFFYLLLPILLLPLRNLKHNKRKKNDVCCLHLLVSIGANARRLIIFGAIIVGTIVKCTISFANWPSATLIHKMPIETNKWSVLITFVLQKTGALFNTKFFQITASKPNKSHINCCANVHTMH